MTTVVFRYQYLQYCSTSRLVYSTNFRVQYGSRASVTRAFSLIFEISAPAAATVTALPVTGDRRRDYKTHHMPAIFNPRLVPSAVSVRAVFFSTRPSLTVPHSSVSHSRPLDIFFIRLYFEHDFLIRVDRCNYFFFFHKKSISLEFKSNCLYYEQDVLFVTCNISLGNIHICPPPHPI